MQEQNSPFTSFGFKGRTKQSSPKKSNETTVAKIHRLKMEEVLNKLKTIDNESLKVLQGVITQTFFDKGGQPKLKSRQSRLLKRNGNADQGSKDLIKVAEERELGHCSKHEIADSLCSRCEQISYQFYSSGNVDQSQIKEEVEETDANKILIADMEDHENEDHHDHCHDEEDDEG